MERRGSFARLGEDRLAVVADVPPANVTSRLVNSAPCATEL